MRNEHYFKGKDVLVVGFGRSGLAAAGLLSSLGARVWVSDNHDNPVTRANLAELKSDAIKVELGWHSHDFVKGKDIIIVSPGVPVCSPALIWAEEEGIPVISEIELAWILCPAEIIAVTGTNGKTTVTTLIGKVLEAGGKRVFVCGNIGRPFCSLVEEMQPGDFVALEVSSFQLETIDTFKPRICALLNLSRNHLDRYKDMPDYLAAKKRIFKNQDSSDYLILNDDDPVIRALAEEAAAKVIYFCREGSLDPNQSAVLAITSILGIGRDLALRVFRDFKGVPHRLEEVRNLNGIRFINDSKSTTTEATLWALNNLSGPLVLISGGREKLNDYTLVTDLAAKKVKAAILIGEARAGIKKAFSGAVATQEATTLKEAVEKAYALAKAGDCVLFSPMCKSFDMFSNYEERGNIFKSLVSALT